MAAPTARARRQQAAGFDAARRRLAVGVQREGGAADEEGEDDAGRDELVHVEVEGSAHILPPMKSKMSATAWRRYGSACTDLQGAGRASAAPSARRRWTTTSGSVMPTTAGIESTAKMTSRLDAHEHHQRGWRAMRSRWSKSSHRRSGRWRRRAYATAASPRCPRCPPPPAAAS